MIRTALSLWTMKLHDVMLSGEFTGNIFGDSTGLSNIFGTSIGLGN